MSELTVSKSVTVRATRERAFTVFTSGFFGWWPKAHHLGAADLADVVLEPVAGGRWYERGVDGVECDWGRVLDYAPPSRLLLAWHLQGDWTYDPDPARSSEIEVRFVAVSEEVTRVELEHRDIERHRAPEDVVRGVGSPNGWSGILRGYAESVTVAV